MRNCLRCFRLRQSVVHRSVEMRSKLSCLSVGDQRADGNKATVSWCKVRTKPKIMKQNVGGVLHHPRKRGAELFLNGLASLCFGSFVKRQQCFGNSGEL